MKLEKEIYRKKILIHSMQYTAKLKVYFKYLMNFQRKILIKSSILWKNIMNTS